MHGDDLHENDNFKDRKLVMHSYKNLQVHDLNENYNFRYWKLIIHGLKILHGAILTKMKILRREIMYFIFWVRRINVIRKNPRR